MARAYNPEDERFHDRERREKEHKSKLPGEDDEPLPPPVEPIHSDEKPKRNDPCPCGSGKKYKQCCGKGGS
ncbi:MAG: SEC-C metal-binding domain-containing protein [Phycisphaerae bacterium]|jgi:preprotein translocase subunit SecA